MAVRVSVEPFETEFMRNWSRDNYGSNGGELSVSFFGTEIWTLKIAEGDLLDHEIDAVSEIAKEELGKILAERLSSRIKPSEWGGIQIDR